MTVGQGFTIFEDAPVADETVASKEAGPRPAVKIGVPDGFTEISKPVRRTLAARSTIRTIPAPRRQTATGVPCSGPLLHTTNMA